MHDRNCPVSREAVLSIVAVTRNLPIEHKGDDFIPLYALNPDDNDRPRKEDAEILNIIRESKDGRGLAFWFAGLNRFLGDVRPQDFLAVNPEQVLATARGEISVVQHG
jgi:hypothetical protein